MANAELKLSGDVGAMRQDTNDVGVATMFECHVVVSGPIDVGTGLVVNHTTALAKLQAILDIAGTTPGAKTIKDTADPPTIENLAVALWNRALVELAGTGLTLVKTAVKHRREDGIEAIYRGG